jgi:hypothetical protein
MLKGYAISKYMPGKFTRIYIMVIMCFWCGFHLIAQENIHLLTNWDYQRDEHKYEKINHAIVASNGYIIAVGESTGDSFKDLDGLFLVIEAKSGKLQLRKKIGEAGDQSINTVVQNPDGTFLVAGYTENLRKKRSGWIATIDLKGNLLQAYPIQAPAMGEGEILSAAINDAGTIITVGTEQKSGGQRPWVSRIKNGKPEKNLKDFSHLEEIKEIVRSHTGGFILVGNTSKKNLSHPSQIWAMSIDENGNDVWGEIKYFGKGGFQEVFGISGSLSNDGYLISGVTNHKGKGMTDMWLIKIDEKGALVWDKTFGGPAADVACSALELPGGTYAVFGHTWSHMPRARHATLQLWVVGRNGEELDRDTYPIIQGEGDELASCMMFSPATNNLIMIGNAASNVMRAWPTTYLSSVQYYTDQSPLAREKDVYGSKLSSMLRTSVSTFRDANLNHFLDPNEKGYVEFDITNTATTSLDNVTAQTDLVEDGLVCWSPIYIGRIAEGQTKKIQIPIQGTGKPLKSTYELPIQIHIDGQFATTHTAIIHSNQAASANLIVNKHQFLPKENPQPGEPIVLTVDITNIGSAASIPVDGAFILPSGIESNASEGIKIPALQPGKDHSFSLAFTLQSSYRDPLVKIVFQTASSTELLGIKKTFTLPVALLDRSEQRPSATSQTGAEIYWVSHDVNRQNKIDVTRRALDIKAMALSDGGLRKNNFAVLINGRRTQGQKMDEAVLTPPQPEKVGRAQQFYTRSVKLSEGINEIQIVYFSEDGEEMARSTPLIFNYYPQDKPNLYVLSIGVAHGDLEYTVNDAKTFANVYARLRDDRGRGFKKVEVKQLVNASETTENNIKRAFVSLSKNATIKDNDLVVVFISSHGKVLGDGQYVLLPSDYDPQYEELTTIDFNEDILKRLRSVDGKKLVFIDACHSGSAGSRSFSDAAASKVMSDLIQATAGLEIFASCGDHEFSYEDVSWGNGAFTKAIVEAFENKEVEVEGEKIQADIYTEVNGEKVLGSDGVITIEELKLFVQQRVPYLVQTVKNKVQHPANKSTALLPRDMGIYMVARQ